MMNKLLYVLLGVAALFVAVALFLRVKSEKPPAGTAPAPVSRGSVDPTPQVPGTEAEDLQFPDFDSPESLAADYASAVRGIGGREMLDNSMIKYFACRSFKNDDDAECDKIDKHLDRRKDMACMQYRHNGLDFREAVQGGGAIKECVRREKYLEEKWGGKNPEGAEQACRIEPRLPPSLDTRKSCEEGNMFPDIQECMKQHAHLSGDSAKCSAHEGVIERTYCEEQVKLIRALHTKKAEHVEGTVFATVMDREASCQPLAKRVLERYRESAKALAYAQGIVMRQRRFEAQEKARAEREKTAKELATHKELSRLAEEAAAREAKRKEEGEKQRREEEERVQRERTELFEQAAMEDEAKRREKGLKMRDEVDPKKYKKRAP